MNIKLINIIILFLFGFALNKNLRLLDEPVKFDDLLAKIPKFYTMFVEKFYDNSPYKGNITLDYIKDAESTGQKKSYLNIRKKELLIVTREVLEAIRVTDEGNNGIPHYKNLFNEISTVLEDHLNNDYNDLKWYSYFVGTTDISKVGKVGHGFLFFIKKGETLDIILVFGFAKNIIPIKTHTLLAKKYNMDSPYSDCSCSFTISSIHCKNDEDEYLFEFLKMVSVKIFGNYYHINLDYPKLK